MVGLSLQVTATKSGINRWPELQEDSEGMKATTDTKTGGGRSQ